MKLTSHAHYDHTGGLPLLLPRLRHGIPLFANGDLLRERFLLRDGQMKPIGLPLSREALAEHLTLATRHRAAGDRPGSLDERGRSPTGRSPRAAVLSF
jgi:metal-dependent hydrolase (beta-lactamase superfamily II)